MTSRPDDKEWLEENLLPVMIAEVDPHGPRDLETDDDPIVQVPQGVVDAMEKFDRALLKDRKKR